MSKSKQQQTQKIINELLKLYPEPECALNHSTPWELLVATILSAQCTDVRVNLVTPALFKKFPDVKAFAEASITSMEKAVKSTGFYRNKAKNIIACAQTLIAEHSAQVPDSIDKLIKLPGVGRKTASVILGTSFNKAEGIVVDTHVGRLSRRFGLTANTDAVKVEKDLMKLVAKKHWIEFSHLLILHGRNRCKARKPDCKNCEIQTICPQIIS